MGEGFGKVVFMVFREYESFWWRSCFVCFVIRSERKRHDIAKPHEIPRYCHRPIQTGKQNMHEMHVPLQWLIWSIKTSMLLLDNNPVIAPVFAWILISGSQTAKQWLKQRHITRSCTVSRSFMDTTLRVCYQSPIFYVWTPDCHDRAHLHQFYQ